jgi:nucleoside 2-deoxyribosyltransferase
MKVYLAGHMPKRKEADWRDELIRIVHSILVEVSGPDVEFLTPRDVDLRSFPRLTHVRHEATSTKDHMFLNVCDVFLVYLNLNMGHCLGSMYEMGYAKALHIPIILINSHPEMPRTKFLEHNSDIVTVNVKEAAEVIAYMARK